MIGPKADKNTSDAQNLYFEPLDGLIVVEGNDWSQCDRVYNGSG